jgi:hypothetical protein
MLSSGMLRRVALARRGVSEERSVSLIRAIRIEELGKTLAVTNNRRTLRRNAIPEDDILQKNISCVTLYFSILSHVTSSARRRLTVFRAA